MKVLSLHLDYIKFKPKKKAIKKVKKVKEKEKEVKNCLGIFIAIEKGDSQESVKELVKEVKDISKKVKLKIKKLVLYPYSHLSSNLASPDKAERLLEKTKKELKKDFKVVKAPFGYYKEFELKCKGHPLSELSREISGGEEELDEKGRKRILKEISESKLDTRKLKDNDHRILGKKMDLFSFNDVAPGMVFWHNNGLIIDNELIKFWREKHKEAGYKEISTPQILDKKLWLISGHWDKYKENIFLTDYENRDFAVKPMNCPGGILVYKTEPKSYKDLPLKISELGVVHRQELSGVLGGLFRVIKFAQDDAHIYCKEEQLEEEISKVIDLVDYFYKKFNFNYKIELSTRPEKRIGTDKQWDMAEGALKNVLKKKKIKYKISEGEGAFYGPKIDFHIEDSLKRTWQLATIQVDFAMPERFDIKYKDKDNKNKTPIMVHRAIYGSFERFIGILLEHTKGHLPTWLSPIQVRVISFTDKNINSCKKFIKEIGEKIPNLRLDADFESNTVNSKIKQAEIQKIPYIIVIGDKEEKSGNLSVRKNGKVKKESKKKFISNLKKEIEKKE
jgi:threonyl-tRNA synthetase